MPKVREVYLQCKECGATITAEMKGKKLLPTRKLEQVGDRIYHVKTCGEVKEIKGD